MSISNKHYPLVVNNSTSISSNKNTKKKISKSKQKQIKINSENKENICINIPNKKYEEDNLSTKQLKSKELEENIKVKETKKIKTKLIEKNNAFDNNEEAVKNYENSYDKYAQKKKERTMRIEVEKIYRETERLKQKYIEKNSYLHKFSNNPQFKNMLKKVEKQILIFFVESILINIFSEIIYFKITKGKDDGVSLVCCCLSIALFSTSLILLSFLKLKLLNDPYISKAFRFFVVIEFFLFITSFGFNNISIFLNIKYIKKIEMKIFEIIIYIFFIIIILFFFLTLKYCINLFNESVMILLGKKTEYSQLMINEQNSQNLKNSELKLSNSITTEGLNNTNSDLLDINDNIINSENNKDINNDEEKFKNYNYFSKFHYSVSSDRKDYNF